MANADPPNVPPSEPPGPPLATLLPPRRSPPPPPRPAPPVVTIVLVAALAAAFVATCLYAKSLWPDVLSLISCGAKDRQQILGQSVFNERVVLGGFSMSCPTATCFPVTFSRSLSFGVVT